MIHDRTGLSDIQPEEGVETVFAGPAMEDPIEAQEREDHEQLMQAIAEAESEKEVFVLSS